MNSDEMFYVAQKAIINKGGEILVLNDPIEGLDFPGGKMQEGETSPEESLAREVYEEVGLKITVGKPFLNTIEPFQLGHRFYGKRAFISWYLCEYVSGEIKLSEEHASFTWVNKDNYKTVDDGTSFFSVIEKLFSSN